MSIPSYCTSFLPLSFSLWTLSSLYSLLCAHGFVSHEPNQNSMQTLAKALLLSTSLRPVTVLFVPFLSNVPASSIIHTGKSNSQYSCFPFVGIKETTKMWHLFRNFHHWDSRCQAGDSAAATMSVWSFNLAHSWSNHRHPTCCKGTTTFIIAITFYILRAC